MLATLVLFAATALFQEPPQPPAQTPGQVPAAAQPRPRRDPLKRFEGLDLTQDQKDRLRAVFAQGRQDRRERRKAVLGILTPEQRRKLRAQRQAAPVR
jgi:Spy/CpxP family protein refolding chaperone